MLVKYALSFLDAAELNSEPEEKKMLGVTFPSQLCIPSQTKKKIKNPGFLFQQSYLYMMPENTEGTDLGNADDAVSHLCLCEAKALN